VTDEARARARLDPSLRGHLDGEDPARLRDRVGPALEETPGGWILHAFVVGRLAAGALEEAGARVVPGGSGPVTRAEIPLDRLPAVAALDGVRTVQPRRPA
jgi:hypothetical protein